MKPIWPFIGNEKIGELMIDLVATSRWPAAVALVGSTGLGKATAARWLAQRDLCQRPEGPCGECDDCRQFLTGVHPHGVVIDQAEDDSIKIETLRAALERFSYVVQRRAWLVIPDAERLTESAQNMLLKFLEEPPPNVQVILTMPDARAVRPTVVSRLSIWRWHRVPAASLRQAFPTASPEDLDEADGRPGRLRKILADPDRQARRQRAIRSVVDTTLVPPEDLDDEVAMERLYQAEEHILRQWLYQAVGLDVPAAGVPALTPVQVVRRLAAYLQRGDRSWRTVSPRTLYAYLHLV